MKTIKNAKGKDQNAEIVWKLHIEKEGKKEE
jgi:hypothetical protein